MEGSRSERQLECLKMCIRYGKDIDFDQVRNGNTLATRAWSEISKYAFSTSKSNDEQNDDEKETPKLTRRNSTESLRTRDSAKSSRRSETPASFLMILTNRQMTHLLLKVKIALQGFETKCFVMMMRMITNWNSNLV